MPSPRRFFELPSPRRRLLVETVLSLGVCKLAITLGSVRTTGRLLDPLVRTLARAHSHAAVTPADLTWAVETADGLLAGSGTCLQVALVGERLFDAHGYETVLRIGVAKDDDGEFAAHAWLERDGRVLLGDLPDLSQYRPLPLDAVDC